MFTSFASTFDSLSSDLSNSSAPPSNPFLTSPFNFDMNSMSTWSPAPTTSQDSQLDDLFTGYLSVMNPTDYSMPSQSSTSASPVTHHVATSFRPSTSQTSSSLTPAAPQSNQSSPDNPLSVSNGDSGRLHKGTTCKKLITSGDPSPFAPGALRRGNESATLAFPCSEGAKFPKTVKSDQNIEVLTAWKNITSDPKFKVGSLLWMLYTSGGC